MNLKPPPRWNTHHGNSHPMGTKVKIEDIMPGPFHIMHQWVYVCFSAPEALFLGDKNSQLFVLEDG